MNLGTSDRIKGELLGDKNLDRQLESLRRLVDSRTGLIEMVNEMAIEADDPLLFNFTTVVARNSRYGDGAADALQGSGAAGLTRTRGTIGAIGETLERYACSFFDPTEFIYGSYAGLRDRYRIFDPEQIALYSKEQYAQPDFGFSPFTRTTDVCWCHAEQLTPGGSLPILYPALLVYMPYRLQHKGELAFAPTVSTGLAAGPSIERATVTGLLESIERDAFMIAWHNSLRLPRIDISQSPLLTEFLEQRFAQTHLDICLNYMTLDIEVPGVVATAVDRLNPSISVMMGMAAELDPEIAVIKALIELAQDRFYVKHLSRMGNVVEYQEGFQNIDDFEKRVVLYLDPRMIPALDFLRSEDNPVISISDIKNQSTFDPATNVEKLVSIITGSGCTVIRKNVTTSDVAQLGVSVAKTMVPEMQPLEGDHTHRFFGGRRLYDVPVKMGYRAQPSAVEEFNPYPHPLP